MPEIMYLRYLVCRNIKKLPLSKYQMHSFYIPIDSHKEQIVYESFFFFFVPNNQVLDLSVK